MSPILNPSSEKLIKSVVADIPQSLLITGDVGVGLNTVANHIVGLLKANSVTILPEKDEKIDLEKGTISIGIIRKIIDDTRTKSNNSQIIIIDYAERMTHQAQNAFLKLLEEPGSGFYFILLSNSALKLLPTVLSRMQKINIKPITHEQSKKLLDDLGVSESIKRSQLLFMADGLPAELTRLSNDADYFEKSSNIVRDARDALQGRLYQKLVIAQNYKDNRQSALRLILFMAKILKRSIEDSPRMDAINRIDLILETHKRIEANGNIRLCLARMLI